jgi:hypothetical protein
VVVLGKVDLAQEEMDVDDPAVAWRYLQQQPLHLGRRLGPLALAKVLLSGLPERVHHGGAAGDGTVSAGLAPLPHRRATGRDDQLSTHGTLNSAKYRPERRSDCSCRSFWSAV